eukprot:CAMPEP_0176479928 /NCGR_PEP_ID=MMETSP0200_2-20121128/2008_1 /TAXON_ID=947934 /ORGANISM="Chaetoceros sp., Strain GSL56" /LENGTH=454 /DNA_ID=CAMNT_0017876019 /DNA_START=47 /DNA_END=1408 /DNA_ORIENTATION=+
MTAENDVLTALKEQAKSLSFDVISGDNVTLSGNSYPGATECSFTIVDTTLSYSLMSLVLLLQDPSGTFLNYKKLCRKYNVQDSVKTSEKDNILKYFLGSSVSADSEKEKVPEDASSAKRDKRVKLQEPMAGKDQQGKVKSREEEKGVKRDKGPITQQQIMENLNIVVDKRGQQENDRDKTADNATDDSNILNEIDSNHIQGMSNLDPRDQEERVAIQALLSATGFEATAIPQEILDKDRVEVHEKITSFEIPVGDSASILRCGAMSTHASKRKSTLETSQKNFARVLELYAESLKQSQVDKRDPKRIRHTSSGENTKKPMGKPIIIVPNAMTSPITLLNSIDFFQNSQFVPRDVAAARLVGPKPTSVFMKRTVASRLGGGIMEYEIMDNPLRKLQRSADWDRVVAVIAQGAAWQFKGWKMGGKIDPDPVDVFSNAFGYYIGFEGAPIPKDLQGW